MSDRKSALPDSRGVGYFVVQVSHAITQYFNRAFEQYDITFPQSRVMAYLYRNDQEREVNQRDLEKALGIKASSISSLVRNLENKGFVECHRRSGDARNKCIMLTDAGAAVQTQLETLCCEIESILTKGMDEKELEKLANVLEKVKTNIENEQ